MTRINYLTRSAAYIDAGRKQGLAEGDLVEVVRDGVVIAVLHVASVSSRRAACEGLKADVALAVGDTVRFSARAERASPTAGSSPPTGPAAVPPSRGWLSALGARGRVGLRLQAVRDRADGRDRIQPALDVRLKGADVASTPVDFGLDIRSRRTYSWGSDGGASTSGRTRVYRMAGAWQAPDSHFRLTLGRQVSPSLAAVSVFDGALAEYESGRWRTGAFTGTQPDPVSYRYSTEVREHGGFVQFTGQRSSAGRIGITTGVIGSYRGGTINREFIFAQGRFQSRRTSGFVSQELDLNRDWKTAAEGSDFSLTSTFLHLRHRLFGGVDLNAGYDNRRSVRLYRDLVTPETDFDDNYRQGLRIGAEFEIHSRHAIGLSRRASSGGGAGRSEAYTVSVRSGLSVPMVRHLRWRSTRYRNDRVDGWLHSTAWRLSPISRGSIEIQGGVRDERPVAEGFGGRRLKWLGVDLEAALAKRWYNLLSLERELGDTGRADRLQWSLSYRI